MPGNAPRQGSGEQLDSTLVVMAAVIAGCILGVSILRWPYLGIAGTAASLPISVRLPEVGLFTSVISLLGLLTFIGFVLQETTH